MIYLQKYKCTFFSFSYLEKSFIFNPPNFVLLMVEIKFFNVFCLQIVSVAFLRHFKFILVSLKWFEPKFVLPLYFKSIFILLSCFLCLCGGGTFITCIKTSKFTFGDNIFLLKCSNPFLLFLQDFPNVEQSHTLNSNRQFLGCQLPNNMNIHAPM